MPIPIFINGVEAHTVVRYALLKNNYLLQIFLKLFNNSDMLTTQSELRTYNGQKWTLSSECTKVDAIVNTIGFPLVGGPAGSMEGGDENNPLYTYRTFIHTYIHTDTY